MKLKIQVFIIDDYQGDQYTICILNLVVQGSNEYLMGFIKDMARMNVSVFRAKDGMVSTVYFSLRNQFLQRRLC